MVVTRSRLAIQGDHSEEKSRKSSSSRRNNFVITIAAPSRRKKLPVQIRKHDDDEEDDEDTSDHEDGSEEETEESASATESKEEEEKDDEDDEEDEEDEFDVPDSIMKNPELRAMAEKIIQSIKEKSPALEDILRAPIRDKHKEELFEWFMIYESCMPMSEERMMLRKQVFRMLENYKKEYVEFDKHKEMVVQLEKDERHDDVYELQFDILRLETTKTHKEILFQKYTELKEKEEVDEEFYKLKGWLKQALQLPFDRIKSFPLFDHVTEQLVRIQSMLDEELYGMTKVKEQLLLFIHGKIMNPDMKGCCLGLVGEPGVGKCLHPDTPVLLLDGSIRAAKELNVGDRLMGDDSKGREIFSMCQGQQLMYRVVQEKGDDYIVNSSHILTLFYCPTQELVDVEIAEYVNFSEEKKAQYLGVKTSVEFPSRPLTYPHLDPETVGEWWAQKEAVVDLLLFFQNQSQPAPEEYRINDATVRRGFLKGVMKTSCISNEDEDGVYTLELPSEKHADVLYMARSLGWHAVSLSSTQLQLTVGKEQGEGGKPRWITYPISVETVEVGDYVGFIVDGNHRFLLGDFTITHNTSIARCLAKVLEFPFEQISFGGVHHADFIKGFDFTYVGSRPGEIARCLMRMGYKNGILFLDEYEKVAENPEITSSLLHITDFSQNSGFRDNYFNEVTIDLSSLWFVYSMNDLPRDKALKDRIYSIVVEGYSEKDKVRIASDYLFPKCLVNIGKTKQDVVLNDTVVSYLVRRVCQEEKGIRNLEKAVRDVINKLHFLVSNQDKLPCSFMLPSGCFPLSFPLTLTEKMVDVFLKNFSTASPVPNFYA